MKQNEKLLSQIAKEYVGNDPYMINLRETVQKWDIEKKGGN